MTVAAAQIGVDVGGTFTDVLLHAADGTVRVHKLLSTPPTYDHAVVEAVRGLAPRYAGLEQVLLQHQAVKRMLEPDEVADTVAFLLGPAGRGFTGAALPLDLGWTAR